MTHYRTRIGQSYPLGATVFPDGVNFSLFTKNGTAVELLLFNSAKATEPSQIIRLDPEVNRTFYYWHVFVEGISHGQHYGYRVDGPYMPDLGYRFDLEKLLVDPYARAVAVDPHYKRADARRPGSNLATGMKCIVVDTSNYDWEGDVRPNHPYNQSIIYEMHVGGFTKNPNSGVHPVLQGKYRGLIEKIPYLKSLGITAIELLPIQQFDAQDAPPGLPNYWGYSPVAFFAPHDAYAVRDSHCCTAVEEFRDLVKALHKADIEVILDVVFNHTAEGAEDGPTFSFKGLENGAYYILKDARKSYANYAGTGNTINANHSIVRKMITNCLRYWVTEMHIDGFRFDLASVMARDERGEPLENPPILWEIESDPVLAGTKIIAEAWDAGGLYQVGSFIGHRWSEWNGRFRDDVRQFVRGDNGMVRSLASRITGSPDLYKQPGREPSRSVNFITCHDGFTLNDLVSYNHKHNEANQENNRDGANDNYSWNCGVEGYSDSPRVNALRRQQIKNLLTLLFFSQGTPMISMGDEVRRTQNGNNNAYCQDSPLSWFDWQQVESNADILRFVKQLIAFRKKHRIFHQNRFWTVIQRGVNPHLKWHGVELNKPDWSYQSHSLAYELALPDGSDHMHIMVNAYWEPLAFALPVCKHGGQWHRIIDTALESPADITPINHAVSVPGTTYRVSPRTSVVLLESPAATLAEP